MKSSKSVYRTPFQEGKLAETQKYTSNIKGFFSGVLDVFLLVDVSEQRDYFHIVIHQPSAEFEGNLFIVVTLYITVNWPFPDGDRYTYV